VRQNCDKEFEMIIGILENLNIFANKPFKM